ncbi:MAG: GNAT family N-acetyltransferase [Crocosphaera sp.]
MDILIDNYQEQYLDKVIKLQENSLRFLCAESYKPEQINSLITSQKRIRYKYSNREEIIVAQFNHEYLGFAILDMISPQINGMYVHPHYSRQGIGTKLLKKLEELAISKDYKVLSVMSSMNAIKFYKKNGYHLVNLSGYWSDHRVWIPCAEMKKTLIPKTTKEKLTEILPRIIFLFVLLCISLLFSLA